MKPHPEFAVEMEKLEKRFGDFIAVDKISFKVPKGIIYGFLGPNGAGKSTTIRMMCGILEPTSGEGCVAGYDLYTQSEEIKSHIGYMSQKFSLYEDLTVEENINFYSGIYRVPYEKKQERKEWVLEMADLKELRNTRTSALSGGWKQRLALGCAVLHNPPILFLDEPTSGVDPVSRRSFWHLIGILADQGTTIFVTTHYMDEAEYLDYLALIYRGEIIARGTPEKLKTDSMSDTIVEVETEHPQRVLEAISHLNAIKDVSLFGKGVHITTKDFIQTKNQVSQLFQSNGWPLVKMEVITPSLEDVFVSLIEKRDAEEGKQKEFSA